MGPRPVDPSPEAFQGDLYFYSVDHDLRGQLGDIDTRRCPLVLLTGDYDYLTPPSESRRTAEAIAGATFLEMKGIGHFPMSENYPVFKTYLTRALRLIDEQALHGDDDLGQAAQP